MTATATGNGWGDVLGQDRAVAQLRASVESPVHAYLFVGPPASGRREAARAFAADLLALTLLEAPGAAGVLDADENWERIDYFLERVVPVAEASKVRLACHPHDPYTPPGWRGVTRVLGTVEGLKKLVAMRESPYHGLNFCQGTVGEMLDDPATEIFDVIRWFGERDKIFNVHFRNIRGRKLSFMETFPEEGDMDMLRSIRLYAELGYKHMIMPDHVPRVSGRDPQNTAFGFVYG